MTAATVVLTCLLVGTLVLQAILPRLRLLIVTGGAGLAALASALFGTGTPRALLEEVPWDVLVLLVGLGVFAELVAETRVLGVLAVRAVRWSGGRPGHLRVLFFVAMFVVSGLVNNLTALLLVLPVVLRLLAFLGVDDRYLRWTVGGMLVACNLGGAATPIGDFPAILLLGDGRVTFASYLATAGPATVVGMAFLLLVSNAARPERDLRTSVVEARISVAVLEALHRRSRIDRRLGLPLVAVSLAMFAAWLFVPASSGVGPDLVCWLGVGAALLVRPSAGETLLRRRVDPEPILYFLSLFLMVGAVRRTGALSSLGDALTSIDAPPTVHLAVFLVGAALLTAMFSAGPSMAALLDTAGSLAATLPPTAVYVGLALAVCAGSSLLLTAATSGPLAQMLVERADLTDADGRPLRFDARGFLRVGVVSFLGILAVALAFASAWVALAS